MALAGELELLLVFEGVPAAGFPAPVLETRVFPPLLAAVPVPGVGVPLPLLEFLVALNAGSGSFEGTVPFDAVVLPETEPLGVGTYTCGVPGKFGVGAFMSGSFGATTIASGGVPSLPVGVWAWRAWSTLRDQSLPQPALWRWRL